MMMTEQQWLDECKRRCGEDWSYLASQYSFRAAYDDGLSPEQAVEDAWWAWMED